MTHLVETQKLSDEDRQKVMELLKRGAGGSDDREIDPPADSSKPGS
jgi:hypothetical protein